MEFTRAFFDPADAAGAVTDSQGRVTVGAGTAPGDVYVYSEEIVLAVNLAMATGRPLLLSGEPGSGKTTLAINAARVLGRTLFTETITSHTRATDLLWRFDTLHRLNDAQTPGTILPERQYYVEPGILWWAFDPETARQRGRKFTVPEASYATHQNVEGPQAGVVALLDEIDKADPDVPNDLLEPFDVGSFTVRETNDPITKTRNVLLMLTTNGERELPPAFLRRCVGLKLADPTDDWFVTIAERRFGVRSEDDPLLRDVAQEVMAWRGAAAKAGVRRPGTAEYLDALGACRLLDITPDSSAWRSVALAVLWKNDREAPVLETS